MYLLAVDIGSNKGGVLGVGHDLGFDAGILRHGRDLPLRRRQGWRAVEIGGVGVVVVIVNMMAIMIPLAAIEGRGSW